MNVLHVLNYGWPYIDGYTARSIGLISAQREHLADVHPLVATSPFTPLAHGQDPQFSSEAWSQSQQLHASLVKGSGEPVAAPSWERAAVGFSPTTDKRFGRELASIARRTNAHVIHVHHPHYVAATALRVADELGLPCVYELRCFNGNYDLGNGSPYRTLRGHWQNHLELKAARQASAVVTISNGLRKTLEAGKVDTQRTFVIRNSVDTSRFTPADTGPRFHGVSGAGASEKNNTVSNRPTLHIGYATTFERIENLDVAVHAFNAALEGIRALGIDLKVTLAGTGRDFERIAGLVNQLGLNGTISLPGLVPYSQMPAFYRSLDLFLVPRGASIVTLDTTPLKPLEALACGIPMLATDLPAMRELLEGRSDVRFVSTDAQSMAEGMIEFARSPWQPIGEIQARAWSSEVQKYEAVYETAQQSGPPVTGKRAAVRNVARAGAAGAMPADMGTLRQRTVAPLRDNGMLKWAGVEALQTHIVVCGFPRTGSTLFQMMVEACVPSVQTFDGEVAALDPACTHAVKKRFLLTKRPDDVLSLDHIGKASDEQGIRSAFVLTLRDPRDILTSRHTAYPEERSYYLSVERFKRLWLAFKAHRDDDNVYVLRYEDLVEHTDREQSALADFIGWQPGKPFDQFYEVAKSRPRDSMTEGALGGLRKIDRQRLQRWREPQHEQRIKALLESFPELSTVCIDLGYESDDQWTRQYAGHATATSGAQNSMSGPSYG